MHCYLCGHNQDETGMLMPADGQTLFGRLVHESTDYYCSDCGNLHYEYLCGRLTNHTYYERDGGEIKT